MSNGLLRRDSNTFKRVNTIETYVAVFIGQLENQDWTLGWTLDWTWTGLGLDLDWTWTGLGLDLDWTLDFIKRS